MKLLLRYLKKYNWLVFFTLLLAAINIGFSLVDPILLGKMVNLANEHQSVTNPGKFDWSQFIWSYQYVNKYNQASGKTERYLELGVFFLLLFSISVAMIS
ncbi:MAG: ABC transporter ATP-binding protein, partial [Bacteroidia bacterium]